MAKVRLLLLDANVVIELHSLGLWSIVIDRCEVLLSASVVLEAEYYIDRDGDKVLIDLQPDIVAGKISIVSPPLSSIQKFRGRFKPTFLERLDPGEAESLTHLIEVQRDCLICSADGIVWRTLGALSCGEQGLSLEEVLGKIGITKTLGDEFGKAYRLRWTKHGFGEGLQGGAVH